MTFAERVRISATSVDYSDTKEKRKSTSDRREVQRAPGAVTKGLLCVCRYFSQHSSSLVPLQHATFHTLSSSTAAECLGSCSALPYLLQDIDRAAHVVRDFLAKVVECGPAAGNEAGRMGGSNSNGGGGQIGGGLCGRRESNGSGMIQTMYR